MSREGRVPPGSPSPDARPTDPSAGASPDRPGAIETSEETFPCDLCGAPMLNVHCKLVCRRCGYTRDCSDP